MFSRRLASQNLDILSRYLTLSLIPLCLPSCFPLYLSPTPLPSLSVSLSLSLSLSVSVSVSLSIEVEVNKLSKCKENLLYVSIELILLFEPLPPISNDPPREAAKKFVSV